MGQSAWEILFGLAEALDWGSCLCDLCEQREGHSPLLGLEPGSRVSRDQKQGSHWVHITKGCGEREENVNTGCFVLSKTVQQISA